MNVLTAFCCIPCWVFLFYLFSFTSELLQKLPPVVLLLFLFGLCIPVPPWDFLYAILMRERQGEGGRKRGKDGRKERGKTEERVDHLPLLSQCHYQGTLGQEQSSQDSNWHSYGMPTSQTVALPAIPWCQSPHPVFYMSKHEQTSVCLPDWDPFCPHKCGFLYKLVLVTIVHLLVFSFASLLPRS